DQEPATAERAPDRRSRRATGALQRLLQGEDHRRRQVAHGQDLVARSAAVHSQFPDLRGGSMSAQTALAGTTAALSAASSVMGGYQRAAGFGANAKALDLQSTMQMDQAGLMDLDYEQAKARGNMQRVATGKYDVQIAGDELQGEEVMLQAAQEERQ